jgi:hypothetical protein
MADCQGRPAPLSRSNTREVLAIFPPTGTVGQDLSDSSYLKSRASVTVPGFRIARRAA